jgi:hypothetical protein
MIETPAALQSKFEEHLQDKRSRTTCMGFIKNGFVFIWFFVKNSGEFHVPLRYLRRNGWNARHPSFLMVARTLGGTPQTY